MCPSTRSQLAVRFQLKWYIWYITPTATGTGVRRRPHGTQLTLPRFSSFLLDHDVCDMRTKLPVRIMLCQIAIMKQSEIWVKSDLMSHVKAITRTTDHLLNYIINTINWYKTSNWLQYIHFCLLLGCYCIYTIFIAIYWVPKKSWCMCKKITTIILKLTYCF